MFRPDVILADLGRRGRSPIGLRISRFVASMMRMTFSGVAAGLEGGKAAEPFACRVRLVQASSQRGCSPVLHRGRRARPAVTGMPTSASSGPRLAIEAGRLGACDNDQSVRSSPPQAGYSCTCRS